MRSSAAEANRRKIIKRRNHEERMELTDEETLLDILEMYPDLMGAGFDD